MSQNPHAITPLLSSIAPNPNPPSSSSNGNTSLVLNQSQIQRNKLQNVPAFLNKLYNMVDDLSTNELICWSENGLSFIVVRHEEFAKKVLPRFFKHSNFSSFVRQLNMYGFHKVPHLQNVGEAESERWEFKNPHFQQNQPDLLLLVTRKKGRDPEEKEAGAVDMHQILDEIAAIKKHQTSISKELKLVQTDNQILWRENLASRERHHRHQETIDKILRFLASVFSNDKSKHVIPRKRQYLLEDTAEPSADVKSKKREHIQIEEEPEEDEPPLKQTRTDSPVSTPATADLQAAIALNDQTKQEAIDLLDTPSSDSSDVSSLMNLPQFQGLLSLAQTSPALFNQLIDTNYLDLSQSSTELDTLANETDTKDNPLDYINMDDFLNTYNKSL
ncbi:HSF-type DNA-binding-domain-containing protein [Choanephora cucurbitarum]|nr:HSF-type DNA-binding-domain-containing protein [Choanephora cucurbitarum]